MPQKEPDRVQREIEELLDKLDNFVPEERFVSKIKSRRRAEAGPGWFERTFAPIRKRLSTITLGHVLLAGLAVMLLASFAPGLFGGYDRFFFFAGLIAAGVAFIASVIGHDARRTVTGSRRVEKRWRGQVIDYSEPSAPSRIREWWRRRRH
jgi:hypothetical protein